MSNYPPGVTGNEYRINPDDGPLVAHIEGTFKMDDGTRIKFLVVSDGTTRRWSLDLSYSEFTGPTYAATQDRVEALRDALIEQQGVTE